MITQPTVLVVDDDAAIVQALVPFLERSGFKVETAEHGQSALDQLPSLQPDIMVLDVMMPFVNGREVLRRMRAADDWTPVILLTQVGEAFERAMALEEGADDYLNKPFEPHELVARMRSILRRLQRGGKSLTAAMRLKSGSLLLNRTSRRVFLANKELLLTPKAVLVLEYLMLHPDELITRDRLLDAVWGWDHPVGTRAVDTRVAELRRLIPADQLGSKLIDTLPGQGYRFVPPVLGENG
ncbi:MAG: response regulator transcription factor [Chloroflexota bacterium]